MRLLLLRWLKHEYVLRFRIIDDKLATRKEIYMKYAWEITGCPKIFMQNCNVTQSLHQLYKLLHSTIHYPVYQKVFLSANRLRQNF